MLILRAAAFAFTGLLAATPQVPRAAPPHPPFSTTGAGWDAATATYRCAGGDTLSVAYLNIRKKGGAAGDPAFAVIHYGGGQHILRTARSASGARYVALDEQNGYRWWTKGDTGFLAFLPADHTAKETVLLRDCVVMR